MSLIEHFHQDLSKHSLNNPYLDKLLQFDLKKNLKNDDWKYTKLETFFSHKYKLVTSAVEFKQIENKDSDFYVFEYKHGDSLVGDFQALKRYGVTFSLNTNLNQSHSSGLDDYYQNDFLFILNKSYNNELVIEVSAKSKLDKPILIKHQFTGELNHFCCQTTINTDKNSQLALLEVIDSNGKENYINYKANINLKENSKVGHHILQNVALNDCCSLQINSHCQQYAHYNNCIVNTGASYSRSNIFINLGGAEATCDANGLYILKDKQHHDTMSFIKHNSPHTYSNQLYKGILSENSRGIFTGKVRVEKNAQLIDAKQLNKNLLLAPKAQANSRPQMEIYADDVKCAHGSTTGQISDEEMFYFTSRGIDPNTARKMLAHGYSNDVILKIDSLPIRNFISSQLQQLEDL